MTQVVVVRFSGSRCAARRSSSRPPTRPSVPSVTSFEAFGRGEELI